MIRKALTTIALAGLLASGTAAFADTPNSATPNTPAASSTAPSKAPAKSHAKHHKAKGKAKSSGSTGSKNTPTTK